MNYEHFGGDPLEDRLRRGPTFYFAQQPPEQSADTQMAIRQEIARLNSSRNSAKNDLSLYSAGTVFVAAVAYFASPPEFKLWIIGGVVAVGVILLLDTIAGINRLNDQLWRLEDQLKMPENQERHN